MKRFLKTRFTAWLLTAVLIMALAGQANAYTVTQSWARVSAVAGETLTKGQVVCIKDADGRAWKADADSSTLRPAVGIIGTGGAAGAKVEIIIIGRISGWTALSEGALGYLSGTAGAVTQVAPGWNQPLGVALSTTDYYFNFSNYYDTSAITALGVLTQDVQNEGTTADDYEWKMTAEDPTTDNVYSAPDISGAIPVVIAQGYTQTSHSEASAADVTGSSLTLADGWFSEGKTLRYTLGGTVTGANGTISVLLYFEDGAVMTLTSSNGAAGDWTAEFTIVAVSATAQRIIGVLRAEAGAEVITDYAADTTAIGAAGTIPVKAQIALAHANDTITNEYVRVDAWSKAD